MELFEYRSVRPMLLTERHEPIESDESIYVYSNSDNGILYFPIL